VDPLKPAELQENAACWLLLSLGAYGGLLGVGLLLWGVCGVRGGCVLGGGGWVWLVVLLVCGFVWVGLVV